MFAFPVDFVSPEKDPANIPMTQVYEPRASNMCGFPGQQMPYMPPFRPDWGTGYPRGYPTWHASYPGARPGPAMPPMPGACQNQCCNQGAINAYPGYSLPPHMGPSAANGMHVPPVMPGPSPGMMEGPGGNVYVDPMTGTATWYGKTTEEVAYGDYVGSFATGANKANAAIMPDNPAPDDSFWVVELDGFRTLRSFMSIELSCRPGHWQLDERGGIFFVRHQPEVTEELEDDSSEEEDSPAAGICDGANQANQS